MSDSIISNRKECLVCKITKNLHRHHVFYGTANRQKSEDYGCWVYLCFRHHNGSMAGVHSNRTFDNRLKQMCQRKWETLYGTREDFIKVFGRSWIIEEDKEDGEQ